MPSIMTPNISILATEGGFCSIGLVLYTSFTRRLNVGILSLIEFIWPI